MIRSDVLKRINNHNIYADTGWTEQRKIKQYRRFIGSAFYNDMIRFGKTQDAFDSLQMKSSEYSAEELNSIEWHLFVKAWQAEDYDELENEFTDYIDAFMNSSTPNEYVSNATLLDRIVLMSYAMVDNDRVYDLVKSRRIPGTMTCQILEHVMKGINQSRFMLDYITGNYW
jgi:hypothetical protein